MGGSTVCRRRDRPGRHAWSIVLVAVVTTLLAGLLSPTGSRASPERPLSPDPADAAATLVYLRANYQLDRAFLRNAAASQSSARSVSERIGRECPGVLSGAPGNEEGAPPSPTSTPRARGELKRGELQLQTIDGELVTAVIASVDEPDLAARETYAQQVSTLGWSNPMIAPLAQFEADRFKEEDLLTPTAHLCADMETWARSGYHVLSAASREYEAAQTARSHAVRPEGSIDVLLKPYEQSTARALIRKTDALHAKLTKSLAWISTAFLRVRRALGGPEGPEERLAREPIIGRGTTSAGTSFIVRREPSGGVFGSSSCRDSVSIQIEERPTTSGAAAGGSGTSMCLSGLRERQASSSCGNAIESVTVAVPASVQTVRMRLSDGRTITSRVVSIPRRDGGPGGLYVQAIRGYSPFPVSLTELNRDGKVVRVVGLGAQRCRKEPPTQGPTFVTLVSGLTPAGERFTIEGTLVHFAGSQEGFTVGANLEGSPQDNGESETRLGKPKAYPWSLEIQCPPHEAAIVYGILSAPGDSVLARTDEGLVLLTTVALASNLDAEGPLVYGVFSKVPLELIVRDSDGSTLYSESLVVRANEEAEFCAGYTEA
jgi:hypothetical protein